MTAGELVLLDVVEGELRAAAGIARVTAHNISWADRAYAELRQLACSLPLLSADELRVRMAQLDDEPDHANAYGGVFRRAFRSGWLVPTDRSVRSARPDAHARRLVVWRSLIVDGRRG